MLLSCLGVTLCSKSLAVADNVCVCIPFVARTVLLLHQILELLVTAPMINIFVESGGAVSAGCQC